MPRRTALRIVTAAIESRAWEVTTVRVAIGKGARRAVDAVLVPPAVLEAAVAPWQGDTGPTATALTQGR